MNLTKKHIQELNVQGPRYTSYPTAPNWENKFDVSVYESKLTAFGLSEEKSLSLYVHVPFCESRCYFCACSVLIRKSFPQEFQDNYIDAVLKEASIVAEKIGKKVSVRQFHIGGGTPSYLSVASLNRLMNGIQTYFHIESTSEIAIEIDPRFIDDEKLDTLKSFGFNRLSFGIQDFSEDVQEAINRYHSFESVKDLFSRVTSKGFTAINMDLIYGLPNQNMASFQQTIGQVIELKPSRIALYSFAHIPNVISHQRLINEKDLPSPDLKLDLFMLARKALLEAGYVAIAMDHFARPDDPMALAFSQNKLYRNFMGYTTKPADEFIGLGYSSIGFINQTYVQNVKSLDEYMAAIRNNKLPVARGMALSDDDVRRYWVIYQLICTFKVDMDGFKQTFGAEFFDYFHSERESVEALATQGLVTVSDRQLAVTELGKMFVRNVCMVFDAYLAKNQKARQMFSKTI